MEYIELLTKPESKFVLFLGGPGTGKSFTLKYLSKKIESHVICPTWLSAHNAGGTTLYSYCCSSFMSFKPKKFHYKFVFIDEIFMFS